MKPKFLSIIPARIGSKGIPKKNLYPLHGKPLIQWTIEASKKSKYISTTLVSSDDDSIISLSNQLKIKSHKRKKSFANDTTRSELVVLNILDEIQSIKKNFEYLILLQPTSPLRTCEHIDSACMKIIKDSAETLISVKETPNTILKALTLDESGKLVPGFKKEFPFMPRQELPKAFMPNGAIYIVNIKHFIDNKSFLSSNNSFIVMDENSSHDIDELSDIKRVESILELSK